MPIDVALAERDRNGDVLVVTIHLGARFSSGDERDHSELWLSQVAVGRESHPSSGPGFGTTDQNERGRRDFVQISCGRSDGAARRVHEWPRWPRSTYANLRNRVMGPGQNPCP